jgi:hypothetical protein
MYPSVTHLVRAAIKRRYELMPYIYSLTLESHLYGVPSQRWIGWHSTDPEIWLNEELRGGEKQYWFGSDLMVAGVYERDHKTARVYLPSVEDSGDDMGFVRLDSEMTFPHYPSGAWVEAPAHWKSGIAVFAKCGSAIPIGKAEQTIAWGEARDEYYPAQSLRKDNWRGVEIYPPLGDHKERLFGSTWYEDDGVSEDTPIFSFSLRYRCGEKSIFVSFEEDCPTDARPLWEELHILVPPSEERNIRNEHGELFEKMGVSGNGLVHFVLPIH